MTTTMNDNNIKSSNIGKNRWTRVREAYQAGELDRQNFIFRPEQKRVRRNALADISNVSTNANASSQKHQFQQLVERVRELQKEIVPDLFLYQLPQTYSTFSSITPTSNASRGSLPIYPHRQSLSLNSDSTSSLIPNQRFCLSSRILERAHQIPERFWIDWQQKQMQDRIEELEYIKNNLDYSSNSSLLSNEIDENITDIPLINSRDNYDKIRRQSLKFLHEAQRLANERRASLARTITNDVSVPKIDTSDTDQQNTFSFDQRSEETIDTANLNDFKKISPKPSPPSSPVQQSQPTLDRSRLSISLPFTYTNTREQIKFPNNSHQICPEPSYEKVVEINDDKNHTISPTDSIEDVAQIDTEFNLTFVKKEHPILYSKATFNRNIEFRKFRSIVSQNTTKSSNKYIPIHISIFKRKEIDHSRSSSPALSFKSARSRFSSIDNDEDLDNRDHNQSNSIIPSSSSTLSFFSRSQPTSSSSHTISITTQCCNHHNKYDPLLKQELSHQCIDFTQDQSMANVYNLEQKCNTRSFSSSSSSSITPSTSEEEEEEDSMSFTHTLFTCRRHQEQKQKRKGKTSNLSLISTLSLKNDLILQRDLVCRAKKNKNYINNNNNNNKNTRTLKSAYNPSIISSKKIQEWKQNNGGFQQDVLTNDNSNDDKNENDDNDHINRSSSSLSAAGAADCLIQRQCRKQTRLKRKTGSEKKKEKKKKKQKQKKKKERNKKSPSSTIEAEATEASLFQFFTADTPTIDATNIFYPHEQQPRCANKSTIKQENCFPIQTSSEEHHHHHQQQEQESRVNLIMADGHDHTTCNPSLKKKENVRVFVGRHRRRCKSKHQKRIFQYSSSSSSNNSHETVSSTNIEELVSLIQQKLNNKQKKSPNNNDNNKNIIVVNYKPVFVNSRQKKSPSSSIFKSKPCPTDDDFSSATHYSRRRSLTTTSSDGSPLRSTSNQQQQSQSISLDVPDVEDPLMFIEMMYQQLFTEDGRLRNGTEPKILANCVKQIVNHSRRNSISSSTSSHLKYRKTNLTSQQQRKFPSSSKPISLTSSPRLISNENYNTFSEEEEEDDDEPETLVQTIKSNIDTSKKNSKRDETNNHSQIHAFLNSCHQKSRPLPPPITINNNGFHFSIDDTDNEDLDTFSDLNSIRFNNKTIRTSPSVDDDLTHTDSRLLSSSGYQSLDRSRKSFQSQQKLILSKSHSENDLSHLSSQNRIKTKCIHNCPNCIQQPPIITVIPPSSSSSSSSSLNIIQRIQQPIGLMLMKYLNFILISKNVLLLPLLIFFLRQRSMHIGN